MSPEQLENGCVQARADFYTWRSIFERGFDKVNKNDFSMWMQYYLINYGIRKEIYSRDHLPLGDENWDGEIIKVRKYPAEFIDKYNLVNN